MADRVAVLMFHDVGDGARGQGYSVARHQLADALAAAAAPGPVEVRVTFDDGWAGTFRHGLPLLRERRMRATLFATVGFLGTPGHLDAVALRAWHEEGQRVGSHAMTHRPLSLLPLDVARAELRDSKARLEDIVGATVEEFAFPGGHDTRRLRELALESGYARVYTSEPAFGVTDGRVIPRFAVRATTPTEAIRSLRAGRYPPAFLGERLRWTARRALGTRLSLALRDRLRRSQRGAG